MAHQARTCLLFLSPEFLLDSEKDKPYYTLGHGIIILYLAIGFISSFIYYMGLRRSNSRKAKGLCDETILSDEQDAIPELSQQAASEREKLQAQDSGLFAPLRTLRRRYGEADGGVYATVNEAKEHKGDAYSGFGECRGNAHVWMVWRVLKSSSPPLHHH